MITERFLLGSVPAEASVAVTLEGEVVNALLNPSAHGWPDASNTGWRSSMGVLTPIQQVRVLDTTLRINGVTVANRPSSGVVTHGPVKLYPDRSVVSLADVSIRIQQSSKWPLYVEKSRVTAQDGVTSALYPIDTRDTRESALTLVTDTTLIGKQSTAAVAGNFVTLERCDIAGGEDNVFLQSGVHLRDCFVHDLERITGSHNDSFQSGGANDASVVHCTILCARRLPDGQGVEFSDGWYDPFNAVLMIGNYAGAINGVLFEKNLVDGGNYSFNENWTVAFTTRPVTDLVVRNNRFGRHFRYGPKAISGLWTWEGNVWDDTGAPV